MRKSIKRRIVVLVGALTVCVAAGSFAVALPASAHIVTDVEASCSAVTVDFNYFPEYPVPVTIVVRVGFAPLITNVANISSSANHASVPITSVTDNILYGATVPVIVDVTWVLHGDNHVHKELSITCGSGTTTTHKTTTTTRHVTTTTRHATTTTSTTTTTTKPPSGGDIFQVELRRCTQVHEGYRNFPAGTVIYWKVKQDGITVARGHFTTVAGTGYHFITQNLGTRLKAAPKVGDIQYRWKIGGVEKSYMVRRAPGCSGTSRVGASGLGNIFQVELRRCRVVHVGYQYFPGNTRVTWTLKQGGVTKGNGHFVTTGSNAYTFVNQSTAKTLAPSSKATIGFSWTWNGVPYHYKITRAPGC